MADDVKGYLRANYKECMSKSPDKLKREIENVLAEMADNVKKPHYKRQELLNDPLGDSEESDYEGIELMNVISSNQINKSMPIYKNNSSKEEKVQEINGNIANGAEDYKDKPQEEISKKRKANETDLLKDEKNHAPHKAKKEKTKAKDDSKSHGFSSTITFKDLGGIDVNIEC